ncbi:hypothetical protein [Corynebacterium poyangense]|nr:hypothetical protein [Corynebacterium poyangense]
MKSRGYRPKQQGTHPALGLVAEAELQGSRNRTRNKPQYRI